MQMFFLGETNNRGTYYFHSPQHNGWIVADLDSGKATLHDSLARIQMLPAAAYSNAENILIRIGLGQQGDLWLVDGFKVIQLLRDCGEVFEIIMNNQDGSQSLYGKTEREVAAIARKIKKEANPFNGD